MTRRDHSEFFHQSNEIATHARNCAYIRDILILQGEPTGTDGRLRAEWSSEAADVSVVGINTQDFREPTIYQVDVHDHDEIENGLGVRKTYSLPVAMPIIRVLKGQETISENDSTQRLFNYLSTNPYTESPQLSDAGELKFEKITANYAIEAAEESREIDLATYAKVFGLRMLVTDALHKQTRRKVLQQGIEIDGQYFSYTQSWERVQQELTRIAWSIKLGSSQPALPSSEQPLRDEE